MIPGATTRVVLKLRVIPIVSIQSSRLGRGNVHAIKTSSVPMLQDFVFRPTGGPIDMILRNLEGTADTSTIDLLALPIAKTRTFEDILEGLSIVRLQRVDIDHCSCQVVGFESLFVTALIRPQKPTGDLVCLSYFFMMSMTSSRISVRMLAFAASICSGNLLAM